MGNAFLDSFMPLATQGLSQVGPAAITGQIQGQDMALDRQMKQAQIEQAQAAAAFQRAHAQHYGHLQKLSPQMQALQFMAQANPEQYRQMVQDPSFFMNFFGPKPGKPQQQFVNTAGGLVDLRNPNAPAIVEGTTKPQGSNATTDMRNAQAMGMTLEEYYGYKGKMSQANKLDPDAKLSPEAIKFMAEQLIAGDTSVLQNLGRGMQGGRNVTAVREEAQRLAKAKGLSAPDVALATGEFQGLKAGERTLGTRQANFGMAKSEAYEMADLVLQTSEAFDRSAFPGVNKAIRFFETQSGDVNVRRFGAAINSFVNAYARAISPTGVPTVSDKEHAREILNTADSKEAVRGLMDLLKAEMDAAGRAPGKVKQELREGFSGKPAMPVPPKKEQPAAKMPVPKAPPKSALEFYEGLPKAQKKHLDTVYEEYASGKRNADEFRVGVTAALADTVPLQYINPIVDQLIQKIEAKRKK